MGSDGSDDSTVDAEHTDESTPFVWGVSLGDEAEPAGGNDDDSTDDSVADRTVLTPERYLLAGETVVERVDVNRGWVVATSHRLLLFDPDSPAKRLETVDRPNVVDVRTTGGGSRRIQTYGWRAAGYAVVLLVSGFVARSLGLRSLVSAPDVGTTPGIGGLVSMLSLVGVLVGFVVDLLLVAGVVAGLVALILTVWYHRSRQPTLVIERAGDDDLELPLPSAAVGRRVVEALERAFSDELTLL